MSVSLEHEITALFAAGASVDRDGVRQGFARLREALSSGSVRAAEPGAAQPSGWRVNAWVKQGILLGFRYGETTDVSMDHGRWPFFHKDTLPLRKFGASAGVRIVPGGSSVRDGAYLGAGVICMPPMYVNIGAYVGEQSSSTLMRWSVPARRSARAFTSAPAPRSAACSNLWAPYPSSSRTTRSSGAIPASTRKP
jgi:tetrahydrodipicolinate N-succinyltransferase